MTSTKNGHQVFPNILRKLILWALLLCAIATHTTAQDIESALPTIRATGNTYALIGALSGVASQHLQAGRDAEAAERIKEAISLCRQTKNASAWNGTLMIATQVITKTEGVEAAEKFLVEILHEESENVDIEILVLKELGRFLEYNGQRVRAIQVMHDHLVLVAKKAPGSSSEADVLLSYGRACTRVGLHDLGVPALKKAKELSKKFANAMMAVQCDDAIADACLETGEFDIAKQILLKQYADAKASNDPTAKYLVEPRVAMGLIRIGDTENANTIIDASILSANSENTPSSAMSRGAMEGLKALVSIHDGDAPQAAALCNKGIDSKLSVIPAPYREQMGASMIATDLVSLTHYLLIAGDQAAAQAALQRCEQSYRATLAQRQKMADLGVVASMDAMQTSLSFMSAGMSNVRQQIQVSQGQVDAALVESEKGRGLAQARAMRARFDQQVDEPNAPISIDSIRQIAAQRNVTFLEYSLVEPLDLYTRGLLPKNHKLQSPTHLYIWVVPPSGQVTFKAVPLKQSVAKMVDEFRAAILPDDQHGGVTASDPTRTDQTKQSEPKSFTQSGRELYDLLIAPIESALPDDPDAEVVVIPHGPLFAVPFAALQNADGKQLIDLHTLTTSGSIDLYRLCVACSKPMAKLQKDQILIVGNPDMPSYLSRPDKPATPLNPLPGSEAEAMAIGEMFGVKPLIGAAATETEIKKRMDQARVIHLASHGLLESRDVFNAPYLSAIALAPTADDNGFLTVREVMKKKLQADLVVLSACDSGRGHITGDGVIGLSRGYLTAGVPTTVVSLWPVSDRATAILMVNFYRALAEGKSKASALRSATLSNRDRFEDPKLWAPFVMYGTGR